MEAGLKEAKLKEGWLTAKINNQEFILDTGADITGKFDVHEQLEK